MGCLQISQNVLSPKKNVFSNNEKCCKNMDSKILIEINNQNH